MRKSGIMICNCCGRIWAEQYKWARARRVDSCRHCEVMVGERVPVRFGDTGEARPAAMVVTAVDHENGVVTIGAPR